VVGHSGMNRDQIIKHMEASQEYQRRLDMVREAFRYVLGPRADGDGLWGTRTRG